MLIQMVDDCGDLRDMEIEGTMGVKVFYDLLGDEEGQLHVKMTDEGIIIDKVDTEGAVVATACLCLEDLENMPN